MKTTLFLLMIFGYFINIGNAIADEKSINLYMKNNPNWVNEKSSVSFIGTRCAVLYSISSERTKLNSDKKSESLAKKLETISEVFLITSLSSSKKLGVSNEAFNERTKFWGDTYLDIGTKNWQKYNNFYVGLIDEDFQACSMLLPKFEKIITEIAESQ